MKRKAKISIFFAIVVLLGLGLYAIAGHVDSLAGYPPFSWMLAVKEQHINSSKSAYISEDFQMALQNNKADKPVHSQVVVFYDLEIQNRNLLFS